MTMPMAYLGSAQPKIATPSVRKTALSCCGYTSLQGKPAPWQCPGCGAVQEPK